MSIAEEPSWCVFWGQQPAKRLKRIQKNVDRSVMPPPPSTRAKELSGNTRTRDNASEAGQHEKRRAKVHEDVCATPGRERKRRCVARAFLDEEAGISDSEGEAGSDEEDDLDTYDDGDGAMVEHNTALYRLLGNFDLRVSLLRASPAVERCIPYIGRLNVGLLLPGHCPCTGVIAEYVLRTSGSHCLL